MAGTLKASVSGIRGIVGESLTPEVISEYVTAFCGWLGSGVVAVGRDTRKSGIMVQKIVEGVLLSHGIDVVDIGICPTPTLLHYVNEKNLAGGVLITASHNPIQWNALKLVKSGGQFLNQKDFDRLNLLLKKKGSVPCVRAEKVGEYSVDSGALQLHIDDFIGRYDINYVKQRRFSVAIDPVNGAGAVITRSFLRRLGCDVYGINEEVTGYFGREAEPTPSALAGLAELVSTKNCQVGFAQDPDADRLCVVDENGTPLSEELTLALALRSFYAAKNSGDVAANLSTSRIVDDIAAMNGGRVYRSKVGEANVLDMMHKKGAPIGGEGNGGVIYPALNACRDSFVAMLLILDLLARTKRSLSELVAELPVYNMKKVKVSAANLSGLDKKVKKSFVDAGLNFSESNIDGLRLDFENGWIHVRESNTEPVVRIIAEGERMNDVAEWISTVRSLIE